MIQTQLDSAIATIEELIRLTKEDIDSAKNAKHQQIFDNKSKKEILIKSFYKQKAEIDAKLLEKITPEVASIDKILTEKENNSLALLTDKLEELKRENTQLHRMVLALNEFYTTLKEKMMPTDKVGYDNKAKTDNSSNSILQINA